MGTRAATFIRKVESYIIFRFVYAYVINGIVSSLVAHLVLVLAQKFTDMQDDGISLFSRLPGKGKAKKQDACIKSISKNCKEVIASRVEEAAPDSEPASLSGTAAGRPDPPNQQQPTILTEDGEPCIFRDLGVSEWLHKVCRGLGMSRPTAVQRGCIPAILEGRDAIGVAHTGSGKTAAFALPILQRLSHDPYGIYALVLTPTRELAFQIADQFRAFGAGMSFREAVVVGGLDMQTQAKELARRPHVVVATPGRLRGLLDLDPELGRGFGRVAFLVLDEADRLLEPSFEDDLSSILEILPEKRQTLLFSATMTRTLVTLQSALLRNAFHFEGYEDLQTAGANLKEEYLLVPAKVKEVYLAHLLGNLEARGVRSAMVFAGTCRGCALLAAMLRELEVPVAALHSHISQRERMTALDRFKGGAVPILLATDVASRGLDIPTVDLVINFDLPSLARDYVHRVGRTARAGRRGWSLSFVSQYDIDLVQRIETLIGKKMDQFEVDEAVALKGITQVYAARRAATLKIADEEGRGGGVAATKRRRKEEEKAKKKKKRSKKSTAS